MRVIFDRDGRVSLEGVDDFTGFAARTACPPEALDAALAGAGRREGDAHLWIDRAWLVANGRPTDSQWREKLEKMIAFAASQGWVDGDGAIRAHLVWSDVDRRDET